MLHRSRAMIALLPLLILAGACDDDDDDDLTGVGSGTATVRFVNATNTNIDVRNAGTIGTGNVGYGTSSTCMTVNTSNTSGTGLTFNQAGTTTVIPGFTQNFTANGNYTVVAYPGTGTTGTQFLTISNSGFTPNSGQAGLRIVNAAAGSGNLVALSGGTALGGQTGVAFGTAGSPININAGSQTLTFNTGTGTATVPTTATTVTAVAGQTYTLVIAPAAAGTTLLRTFFVTGC